MLLFFELVILKETVIEETFQLQEEGEQVELV